MNEIGIALVWCAIQVTLIGLLAAGFCVLFRRVGPSAGSLIALSGLLVVVGLSVLAFSPWPRWSLDGVATSSETPPAGVSGETPSDTAVGPGQAAVSGTVETEPVAQPPAGSPPSEERAAVDLDRRRAALAEADDPFPAEPQPAVQPQAPPRPAPADRETPPWHIRRKSRVLADFAVHPFRGLSAQEAAERLSRDGPNTLPEAEQRSGWQILFDQLNSLPNYLLAAAAGVSLLTGGVLDAAVVVGVVAANAAIGYFTETRAEETINSLRRFVQPTAEVVRGGESLSIPAADVVVGDILDLKPGVYVPADCRLLTAHHLSIDESMLTGESMPVTKSTATLPLHNTPLADRRNMTFMGTLVTGGEGRAVVVATGRNSEIGYLQTALERDPSARNPHRTPAAPPRRPVGWLMCGAVCGLVFLTGLLRGYGLLQMLRTAISLAASAVPEGLPAAATINFALGIRRMKEDHVLVRPPAGHRNPRCPCRPSASTRPAPSPLNQMTVTRVVCGGRWMTFDAGRLTPDAGAPLDALPEELRRLLECCVLCHEVKINGADAHGPILFGSSTEIALVRLAHAMGFDPAAYEHDFRLQQLKHRSERRLYMSTLHHQSAGGRRRLLCEGQPAGGALPLPLQDVQRRR